MAGFAKKIFTFDIVDYAEKYKVWEDLGVKNKISFYLIKTIKVYIILAFMYSVSCYIVRVFLTLI